VAFRNLPPSAEVAGWAVATESFRDGYDS
jgi:hypothetical protein